jgi:hypothetical protein
VKEAAAVALALAACAAPQAGGSGALVDAGPVYGPEISKIVSEVEPRIIEILGTRWPRQYTVTIRDGDFWAETRDWDRKVSLGLQSLTPDELPLSVAHELAHVHMRGKWRELPPVLQEGVAYWVSLLALDRTDEFVGPRPSAEACLEVLTLPYPEYRYGDRPLQKRLDYTATWLAAHFIGKPKPRARPQ